MAFLDKKLETLFQMILKSSEPRKDGGHFSRFTSISDLLKSIHTELSSTSSNNHEIDEVHSVILLIWDNWLMSYSNINSLNIASVYFIFYYEHQRQFLL